MGIFKRKDRAKNKRIRPEICLSLSFNTVEELGQEIKEYMDSCHLIEWCVDGLKGSEDLLKEEFLEKLGIVKGLCGTKKLIVDYKGDAVVANRILRWSMEQADMVDIDWRNDQIERLIKDAKRKKTKVIISYHNFDEMLDKEQIAEMYLKMEKLGGDILKVACLAKEEVDTYALLEGAAAYIQLSKHKPIVAIAMGEAGQVSRICAGDFGSIISYASGSRPTAPGQFNAHQLKKYMDKYYKERK